MRSICYIVIAIKFHTYFGIYLLRLNKVITNDQTSKENIFMRMLKSTMGCQRNDDR